MLTSDNKTYDNYPNKQQGGISFMKGTIRCANGKCQKRREGKECPHCGSTNCLINIWWNGKRHKYSKSSIDGGSLDFERALKQLVKMEGAMADGTFNPVDYLSSNVEARKFTHAVERWLEQKEIEAEKDELSFETLKDYKGYHLNYYSKSSLAKMDIRKIEYKDLLDFKDRLPNTLKIKTKRNILNALRACFRWLKREGTIKEMPEFPSIEGNNSEIRDALEFEMQSESLLLIPEEDRDIIEFGCETGLRPGETCALKLCDLDLSKREALIRRTWSGSRLRETTKGKSKLPIPLSDRAYEIALQHIRGRDNLDGFLFVNPRTKRAYRPKVLNRVWRTFSGIDIDHYGASRHSFCTQIIESGANPLEAQRLLRHADIRSTQKYYHATPNKLRGIVNRRGKVIPLKKAEEK